MSIRPDPETANTPPRGATNSLCFPNAETSCFGCCPPIRPAHYDPLDFRGSLRREFVENRRRFFEEGPRFRPIVGYSCWALGFLDPGGRLVGCLLHPVQNGGTDLRHLIDYGGKCGRESCVPARMFSLLPAEAQTFWLRTTRGFDAFRFSSPKANPLFHILRWGPFVLEPLRKAGLDAHLDAEETLRLYPFLTDPARVPLAVRFLFRRAIEVFGTAEDLAEICKTLRHSIHSLPEAARPAGKTQEEVHTHLLPMERDYLDFLRLDLGWERGSPERAAALLSRIERLVRETGG